MLQFAARWGNWGQAEVFKRKMAYQKAKKKKPAPRRVSPLKPGLSGARNWANAHVRAAGYSRNKMMRLIGAGVVVSLFVITGALWLGGFIPTLQASGAKFTKQRLMNAGFVVEYVDVVGEGRISEQQVRNALGVRSGDYLFDMDIKNAQARVQSLNWVDTAIVRRLWPNRIVVHVNERIPYALWQENGAFKLVDATGVNIDVRDMGEYNRLPLVVGAGAEQNAQKFLEKLHRHKDLKTRVSSIVFVNQRRWDMMLADGKLRVLLPEKNLENALVRLEKYHQEHGVLDLNLERIDMRINGRLYLRPTTSVQTQTKRGKRA